MKTFIQMKNISRKPFRYVLFIFAFLLLSVAGAVYASETNGTIDSANYTAKICRDTTCPTAVTTFPDTTGANNSRVNFLVTNTPGTSIAITDAGVTGYAWGENIGWINFSPTNTPGGGVTFSSNAGGTATMTGYAWSPLAGWINFGPSNTAGSGVSINSSGQFVGEAWVSGAYGGWLVFDCTIDPASACVTTDFRPIGARTTSSGGGGGGGFVLIDVCHDIPGIQFTKSKCPDTPVTPTETVTPEEQEEPAQAGGGSVGVSTDQVCSPYLLKFIRPDGRNNDEVEVRKLKAFLAEYEGVEGLPDSDDYDYTTQQAVRDFQTKYSTDVLDFWNIKEPTAYVYLTTTRKINSIVCAYQKPDLSCPYFSYARVGEEGEKVKRIQKFLNTNYDENVREDGVFDQATLYAVNRFQNKFRETVLDPWNLKHPTGYVYKSTVHEMHKQVGCFERPIRLENGVILN